MYDIFVCVNLWLCINLPKKIKMWQWNKKSIKNINISITLLFINKLLKCNQNRMLWSLFGSCILLYDKPAMAFKTYKT